MEGWHSERTADANCQLRRRRRGVQDSAANFHRRWSPGVAGARASHGVPRRRRSSRPRGRTVFEIPSGWTVFETPSTPWAPTSRPMRHTVHPLGAYQPSDAARAVQIKRVSSPSSSVRLGWTLTGPASAQVHERQPCRSSSSPGRSSAAGRPRSFIRASSLPFAQAEGRS